ncbi:MAG: SCO family protein [Dehalococcoidia bacterium]
MTRPWAALIVLCISVLIAACSGGEASPRLASLGDAPSWVMVAQSGEPLSSEALRGRVYVANFIWTNCRDTCPTLSLQMALLQRRLIEEGLPGDKVALVSFSFDPERDTPERLNRYAGLFGAEPELWYFLTGSSDEVFRVVTRGFGVSYHQITPEDISDRSNLADELHPDEDSPGEGGGLSDVIGAGDVGQFLDIDYSIDYEHQNVFVLVDAEGKIRRYYIDLFLDPDQVMSDVRSLVGR